MKYQIFTKVTRQVIFVGIASIMAMALVQQANAQKTIGGVFISYPLYALWMCNNTLHNVRSYGYRTRPATGDCFSNSNDGNYFWILR